MQSVADFDVEVITDIHRTAIIPTRPKRPIVHMVCCENEPEACGGPHAGTEDTALWMVMQPVVCKVLISVLPIVSSLFFSGPRS